MIKLANDGSGLGYIGLGTLSGAENTRVEVQGATLAEHVSRARPPDIDNGLSG